jgi:hypothetical protein
MYMGSPIYTWSPTNPPENDEVIRDVCKGCKHIVKCLLGKCVYATYVTVRNLGSDKVRTLFSRCGTYNNNNTE